MNGLKQQSKGGGYYRLQIQLGGLNDVNGTRAGMFVLESSCGTIVPRKFSEIKTLIDGICAIIRIHPLITLSPSLRGR